MTQKGSSSSRGRSWSASERVGGLPLRLTVDWKPSPQYSDEFNRRRCPHSAHVKANATNAQTWPKDSLPKAGISQPGHHQRGKESPSAIEGLPGLQHEDARCRGGTSYVPSFVRQVVCCLARLAISSSLIRSERLHPAANVVGASGAHENGHPDGLISVKPNFNFVFSRR